MSNKVFQQNLDDKKGSQPGGPYLIQILFKEPVDMPSLNSAICSCAAKPAICLS